MSNPIYCIMPILAHPEYTRAAIADCLAQSVPTRLLLINQGVDDAFRDELEAIAEEYADRVLLWSHVPPLPSLAATWNRALDFVWEAVSAKEDLPGNRQVAFVVNNDVRLNPVTVGGLLGALNVSDNLLVSAVGVVPKQFEAQTDWPLYWYDEAKREVVSKGGPDFSCFLISRACHDRFRFDENFTPAFCEDLDLHRRLLLAGEGARIFSVNLPYLHYGSATLKSLSGPEFARIGKAISEGSRAYYAKKWGGPVNQETFLHPFAGSSEPQFKRDDGTATTPYLQAHPPAREVADGQIS